MKTFAATFFLGMMINGSAFALGEQNCSDARGSLKRVEKEIWGANLVHWELDGEEIFGFHSVQLAEVELDPIVTMISGNEQNGTFVTKAKVTFVSGQKAGKTLTRRVICEVWSNNALD